MTSARLATGGLRCTSPCNVPSDFADPDYPYPRGDIGRWGFDFRTDRIYPPKRTADVMGYCIFAPTWISDYNFKKALRFRASRAGQAAPAKQAATLVWGTISGQGIVLNPAFKVNTVPVLPSSLGDYTLMVLGPRGRSAVPVSLHTGGDSRPLSIRPPVPLRDPERRRDRRIVVLGPEGRDEIGDGTEPLMAMVWRGDQVVGIYSNLQNYLAAEPSGLAAGTTVIISDGVPR